MGTINKNIIKTIKSYMKVIGIIFVYDFFIVYIIFKKINVK